MANYIQIYAFEPSAEPKVEPVVIAQEVLEEDNLVPPGSIEETNDNVVSISSEYGEANSVIE